ncbi:MULTISPECIES: DEAD/DEAH box helicase [unclassified Lentimicrobium]|uniref:DEAD/DEAH box helicase n=1 Tax=unclassified Lentimicrobium TaxID=2677434 RepID=UPI001554135D|nr:MULTISPECIES: DEAD/DEAH box helicase [unclassified Lentimicrobium]NPD45944.1 DEAD/DEAH box helicase [Lentimicrobium sp. S6]NPD84289.1 DEAD/DEAH box helicase [Lentimicrobium sp. L6]
MKFEDYNFSEEVKMSIGKLGFKKPTDIQYKTIPHILKGEDVLAIAQTGTGKTAAFAIPIIEKLHTIKKQQSRKDGIKAIVMVPTRELAIQINEVFVELSGNTRVKSFSVFGGVEQDPQIHKLEKGIDILIATPGRLFDLVSQGFIKLNRINILVLDEADHMLNLGFIKDIRDLIKHLPHKRQTLFFSATIDQEIKKLAYSLVTNPIRIQISPKDPVSKNVDHALVNVEMDDKRFFLERLVKASPDAKFIVFTRTKVRADRVVKAMERVSIHAESIHSDREQVDRNSIMDRFKKGETKLLIATDISSRGIDIPNVDYVINYDMPEQSENYVHRVGRTGRGRERGQAFSFCSTEEKPLLVEIEDLIGKKIPIVEMDREGYKAIVIQSNETHSDWKSLMKDMEVDEIAYKKRKRKKK